MNVRLSKDQKVKIGSSGNIYKIMQQVLLRENKYGITKEHFWVVGLGLDNRIIYIELVSLDGVNSATVNPNEVFTLAAQRGVPKLILVHNHPSGTLDPTEEDKDLTDRLI
jgi:DNA repair protein RadC